MKTQFIQVPRKFLQMDKGTKFIDVLVYSAIDFQKNNGKSRIAMRTIADKYNIPLSKVEEAIKRLKESGYLDYTQIPSQNFTDRVFNEYSFPLIANGEMRKFGYLKLKPELLTQELKPKEKGLLIYLQLVAIVDGNEIGETKIEDIASNLGISRQTTSKYLKHFVDIGQITKGKHLYKCKYLAKEEKPVQTPLTLIL